MSGRGDHNRSSNDPNKKHKDQSGGAEKTYNLVVDDVPYIVRSTAFSFNGEARFYIAINDGPDHVFTWDSEIGRLRAIDDSSGELPDALEEAISRKLEQQAG